MNSVLNHLFNSKNSHTSTMSSPNTTNFISFNHLPQIMSLKLVAITVAVVLFLFYTLLLSQFSNKFLPFPASPCIATDSPTNLSHIGFIVVSSLATWKFRNAYTLSWWRPNITRGYVILDQEPTQDYLPWPSTSPPYIINEDITKLRVYPKLINPPQVRMFRSILDMYRAGDNKGLRWLIMCDDDTIFFVDNLVEVLNKYDHTKYYYIGDNSECIQSNSDFSFEMGFGGAGYALSYPLAEKLSNNLDDCIERYPYVYVSDHEAQTCLADLGIGLTIEKGIHQIDLHGDISGFLSAHPQSPILSLHHFDSVDPIFPSMDRYKATDHLMKAAKYDQSRLLQQTVCYQRERNWSLSVSWGYSVHIYEEICPRSILRKPLETFKPWNGNAKPPFYMFNTRWHREDPCETPRFFFFHSVNDHSENQVLTTYVRSWPRNLPPGNSSADLIQNIQVLSPATTHKTAGEIECCDVEYRAETDSIGISIRSCLKDEVIA